MRKSKESILLSRAQKRIKQRSSIAYTWVLPVLLTFLVSIVIVSVLYIIPMRSKLTDWEYTLQEVAANDVHAGIVSTLQDDGRMRINNTMHNIAFSYAPLLHIDADNYAYGNNPNAIYRWQLRQENGAPRFQILNYFTRTDDGLSANDLMTNLSSYFLGLDAELGDEDKEIGMVAGYMAQSYAFQSLNNNGCLLTVTGDGWCFMSILLSPPEESEDALTEWAQFLTSLEVME